MFIARAAFVLRSVGRIINRRDKNGLGTGFLVASERPDDQRARARHRRPCRRGARSVPVRARHGPAGARRPPVPPRSRSSVPGRSRPRLRARGGRRPLRGQGPGQAGRAGEFGYLPLAGVEGKIHVGQPVNIIQHPGGGRKQIVFRESTLKLLPKGKDLDNVAHYTGDTKPGSSGSPVFSDAWEVIALHHSGVPDTDEQRPLARPKRRSVGQRIPTARTVKWVANEGIRVSRLVRRIEAARMPRRPARRASCSARSSRSAAGPPRRIPSRPTPAIAQRVRGSARDGAAA